MKLAKVLQSTTLRYFIDLCCIDVKFKFLGTTLEQDMAVFLQSSGKDLCDLTLMVGGTSLPAHKAVLAARCSYFEAMFRSFMPPDNTVNVRDSYLILLYIIITHSMLNKMFEFLFRFKYATRARLENLSTPF